MAASFTPVQPTLGIAHGDLRLVRLLGHGNPFHEAPDEQFLHWRCFQGQFGTHSWMLQPRTDNFYMLRASALGGPVLWACVVEPLLLLDVPLHNNSTYSWPGQLQQGRNLTNCLVRMVASMTVPRCKSLSSSVRPFYCKCISMEIAWCCARFYTPVSNGCGWNSWIHSFEGMSTYFCMLNTFLPANETHLSWQIC